MNDLKHEAQAGQDDRGEWLAHIIVRGFNVDDHGADCRAWTNTFNKIGALYFEEVTFHPEGRA